MVERAEVRDEALVANAVVTALGLRDQATTKPLQLLLLPGRCEHLLGAAAQLVADVLRAAPNVQVVTTSREQLQVPGEPVMPVPPLELPEVAVRSGPSSALSERPV